MLGINHHRQNSSMKLVALLLAILVTFEQPINANEVDDSGGTGAHGGDKRGIIPCNMPHQPDYQPNIYDCTSFFICVGHFYQLLQCPSGLYFSERSVQCDWPHKVECPSPNVTPAAASAPTNAPGVTKKKKKFCNKPLDQKA